jgi:hypothetical protein
VCSTCTVRVIFHPSNVIDNEFLCSLEVGIDPGWVEERVRILDRRTTLSLAASDELERESSMTKGIPYES